jgi:hypothetical protein
MRGIQYAAASRFQSLMPLEYWIARSSRAMTVEGLRELFKLNTKIQFRIPAA